QAGTAFGAGSAWGVTRGAAGGKAAGWACLLVLWGGALSPPPAWVPADPPALSPDVRDQRNRLDVHYHLNAAGEVSTSIVAADGRQWQLHDRAPRPLAGDYVFQFDGTVPGPGPNERRGPPPRGLPPAPLAALARSP